MDKSHKLTLRTLTLNKEGAKKKRENIGGGQECGLRGGEIVFIKEVARKQDRKALRSDFHMFKYPSGSS